MPRCRRSVAARTARLNKQLLPVLPRVLEYVDSPTVLLSVRKASKAWAASAPPLQTLALRSATATHIGMLRTDQMRFAALQGLLRVSCNPMNRQHLRAVDIATVVDEWGGHNAFIKPDLLESELEALLQCTSLESISMCVAGAEKVLPYLLRKPTVRFARLVGVGFGDISGDTILCDDIRVSIAASRLHTLHLRYASWAGQRLVLPETLKEFVVESFPQVESCPQDDEDEVPGQVVVGKAKLELLALSMSSGWGFEDSDEGRVGCWNHHLLQSFSDCGCLRRVILPKDAYCVTAPAVTALQRTLERASRLEQLHSWSLLGLQCQRLNIFPGLDHQSLVDATALRFAQLPRSLKQSILEFAHEGPVVERPSVWQPLRGKEKAYIVMDCDMNGSIRTSPAWEHIGFPTLAEHCSAASDLHFGNEFVIGRDDLHADLRWQHARAQEFEQAQQNDSEPSKRQKRRQKDKRRKERVTHANISN